MARFDTSDRGLWRIMARRTGFNARQLSQALKISPRQLQRYTQNLFQMSPQYWLNTQRMYYAADLLKKERCVKSVAFNLGFKQVSHFSREFKNHYGLSPIAFLAWLDREAILKKDFGSQHG